MRAVVQRVTESSVMVDGQVVSRIGPGLLILLGMAETDSQQDVIRIADRIAGLRIFEDEEGKMNRSVRDTGGSVLVVSQFTLYGDCRRGRRPSFIDAARPEKAIGLYESVIAELQGLGVPVQTGVFRACMEVQLVNDGPVTLLLDSQRAF